MREPKSCIVSHRMGWVLEALCGWKENWPFVCCIQPVCHYLCRPITSSNCNNSLWSNTDMFEALRHMNIASEFGLCLCIYWIPNVDIEALFSFFLTGNSVWGFLLLPPASWLKFQMSVFLTVRFSPPQIITRTYSKPRAHSFCLAVSIPFQVLSTEGELMQKGFDLPRYCTKYKIEIK